MVRSQFATARFLLTGMMLAAGSVKAGDSVHQWLNSMGDAMRMLNYEGELVYQHGNQVEILQMVHTVKEGRERERISSLNGSPREVIRDNDAVVCVLPEAKAISIDKRGGGHGFPSLMPLAADDLAGTYDIAFAGHGRVAGRDVKVIDILPKDDYRYAHRLYLDQQHRLPLKLDMRNKQGKTVAMIMFSRLKVDERMPFDASRSSIHTDGYKLIKHEQKKMPRLTSPLRWTFAHLPHGFRVNVHDVRKDEKNGDWREHVVVSDGLATVSVYIEQAKPNEGLEGPSSMGAMSAYGRRYGDDHITAVGEVPVETVRLIAEAVDFSK